MNALGLLVTLLSPTLVYADKVAVQAATCTLTGTPLEYENTIRVGGIVVTPSGELAVIDGDGRLRRYNVDRKAKDCRLSLASTLTLSNRASAKAASITVDRNGTIYVSSELQVPQRVVGDKVSPYCDLGDLPVLASPLSDGLWRSQHGGSSCPSSKPDFTGWFGYVSGKWAVDDRAVVYGQPTDSSYELVLFEPGGKRGATLQRADGFSSPRRVIRCGTMICAADHMSIAMWNASYQVVGVTSIPVKLAQSTSLMDFASGPTGTFVLLRDNSVYRDRPKTDRRKAWIVRIDGLPK